MSADQSLMDRLTESPVYREFVAHEFFSEVKAESKPLSKSQVAVFVGQWWHPLHYFPTFLARTVSVLPDISSKSAITHILSQEVGDGKPDMAHEVIYTRSMRIAGFDVDAVTGTAALPETTDLVNGYEKASAEHLSALGFVFATEVTDLLMVSTIGLAVERATGIGDLEWVDIHISQEPDHVEEAGHSLTQNFGQDEEARILASAEDMWRLWHRFFDGLAKEIDMTGL